jgi:predicted transposase/invertase (TIGR01784 family)
VELIEYENLTGEQLHQMKIDAQRKVVRKIDEDKARKEGREEGRKEGREEGRKEGREEGEKKGRKETAINMLEKGFNIDMIVELTGLEPDEIEALQK